MSTNRRSTSSKKRESLVVFASRLLLTMVVTNWDFNYLVSSHTWVPTVLLIAWSWRPVAPPLGLWRLPLLGWTKPCTEPVGPLCPCWSTQPFVIDGLVRPVKRKAQKISFFVPLCVWKIVKKNPSRFDLHFTRNNEIEFERKNSSKCWK